MGVISPGIRTQIMGHDHIEVAPRFHDPQQFLFQCHKIMDMLQYMGSQYVIKHTAQKRQPLLAIPHDLTMRVDVIIDKSLHGMRPAPQIKPLH